MPKNPRSPAACLVFGLIAFVQAVPLPASAQTAPAPPVTAPAAQASPALPNSEAEMRRELAALRLTQRDLKAEDAEEYPVGVPLSLMVAGVAVGELLLLPWVAAGVVDVLTRGGEDTPHGRDRHQRLVGAGLAFSVGGVGLGLWRYRVRQRPNRERLRALNQRAEELRRKLRALEPVPGEREGLMLRGRLEPNGGRVLFSYAF